MRSSLTLLTSAAALLAAAPIATRPLAAQAALQAAPSTRATAQVELSVPQAQGQAPAAGAQQQPPRRIRVDYGQPHLRGRTLHTADLLPYDQPWRTGANAPTTLETDVDLTLGGQAVPRGTYVLWTIPARTGWTLVLQKSGAGEMGRYAQANDVARIPLRVQTLASPVESFSVWLIPAAAAPNATGAARGELRMAWGTTQLGAEWAVR